MNEDLIRELADKAFENTTGELIWLCNLNKRDIDLVRSFKESFWRDVLIDWREINFCTPTSKNQVINQIIWLNSNIRIGYKPIDFVKWRKKGITKIKDLLDEKEEKFLSKGELDAKFGCNIPFTELWGIIEAIPTEYKRLLKTNGTKENKNWFEIINQSASNAKIWGLTQPQIDIEHIKKAMKCIYQITNVPKFRAFQYK